MTGTQTMLRGELTDYRQRTNLAHALLMLELLACAAFLAVLLFISGTRLILSAHGGTRLGAVGRGGRIAAGAGILLLTFLGLSFILGLLDIPSAYLPQDNVFELSHYRSMITGFFQAVNGKGAAAHWDRAFAAQLISTLCVGLAGCIAFAAGALKLWKVCDQN